MVTSTYQNIICSITSNSNHFPLMRFIFSFRIVNITATAQTWLEVKSFNPTVLSAQNGKVTTCTDCTHLQYIIVMWTSSNIL